MLRNIEINMNKVKLHTILMVNKGKENDKVKGIQMWHVILKDQYI